MSDNNTSSFKSLLIQATVVLSIVGAYFLIDFNSIYNSLRGEGEYITQEQNCDLRKSACSVEIQDGTDISFEILQKSIPLMKPLTFQVKSSNHNLKNLYIKLYATNMLMGEYKLPFVNKGNGVYEAIGTLPTCPVGFMKWNADIQVEKLSQVIGARFKFETD